MSAGGIIIGVAAIGGGLLWLRSRKAKAKPQSHSECDAICDAAQKATGLPVELCKQGAAYLLCDSFFSSTPPFQCPDGTIQAEDHNDHNALHVQVTHDADTLRAMQNPAAAFLDNILNRQNLTKGSGPTAAATACIAKSQLAPPPVPTNRDDCGGPGQAPCSGDSKGTTTTVTSGSHKGYHLEGNPPHWVRDGATPDVGSVGVMPIHPTHAVSHLI